MAKIRSTYYVNAFFKPSYMAFRYMLGLLEMENVKDFSENYKLTKETIF